MICYRWDISGSMGMDCPCLGDLVLPSSCCVGVVVRRWRRRRWRNDDNDDDDNVGNGATGNGIQRRWRWHDGRRDTMTMAADNDDNEVDGNGATGNDDGYVSYYNIVKLL